MTKTLIKTVHTYLEHQLGKVGFLRKGDVFIIQVIPGIVGRVALNISNHRGDGLIGLTPIVSIESEFVRFELNRLTGQRPGVPQPSLTSMIGYLMPEKRFLEWLLSPNDRFDQRNEVPRMCSAIELYGLDFMHKKGNLDEITRCLETLTFSSRDRAAYQLPIIYRSRGLQDLACNVIAAYLEEIQGREDIAAKDFRAFSDSFLHLAEGTGRIS